MLSLWFSNQERKERTKHCCWLFVFFVCLATLLICWIVPTLTHASSQFPFSKVFSSLKTQDALSKTVKYLGLSVLTIISLIFVYRSILEIFFLVTPPTQWRRAKRYLFLFTALTFAPLICTLIVDKRENDWKISNATQYFFFQFYFFIANRIGWRFFIKFLLPEIIGESSLVIKKVGGKLTRQHYLGWTAFFLLAFYLPIWVLLLVVAISFFNNSFSFLFGRKIGTTRLSEYSTTKTLEGSMCSSFLTWLFFSTLAISLFKSEWFGKGNFYNKQDTWFIIFVILLTGVVSFLTNWGDCTFSLCKRALGYKNFGRLFGIKVGGFWDRFDSLAFPLFFTSIIVWAVLAIVKSDAGIPFGKK